MYSGPIPWQGVIVQVIHGPYKACQGIVQDVNRSDTSYSGLSLWLELSLNASHGVCPFVNVDYEDVRDTQ